MTPKKQMNIRISDYTRQQVEALQACLGLGEETETQTRVIATAIDRMYKDEQIAADLREIDPDLSQVQAEKYAQAIRRVLDSK